MHEKFFPIDGGFLFKDKEMQVKETEFCLKYTFPRSFVASYWLFDGGTVDGWCVYSTEKHVAAFSELLSFNDFEVSTRSESIVEAYFKTDLSIIPFAPLEIEFDGHSFESSGYLGFDRMSRVVCIEGGRLHLLAKSFDVFFEKLDFWFQYLPPEA